MDCIHVALVLVFRDLHTWQMLAFGLEFQRGRMEVSVRVLASSHVSTAYMMKVWAAEWSEWSQCQTLTSCGFPCPCCRRYLKFASDPQISHVACISTEIPPRSIGCFEMDVNMNLFAIYLRPFGCLYSVTALQGHRRVFNLSWSAVVEGCLSHQGLCVCESVWKTKGWREISQYY